VDSLEALQTGAKRHFGGVEMVEMADVRRVARCHQGRSDGHTLGAQHPPAPDV
jgi:hypothetical protein